MRQKQANGEISITRKLTLVLVSALVLTMSLALLRGYKASMAMAETQLDSHLQAIATIVNAQLTQLETLTPVKTAGAFYFLVLVDGKAIAGSELLVEHQQQLSLASGLATQNVGPVRLRTYSEVFAERLVVVAEPVEKRFSLAESMIVAAMTPQVVVLPLLAAFIAWLIYSSLRPLRILSTQLRSRNPKDFAQLQVNSNKAEVAIVISTLNDLLQKVEAAYLKERYFASDAAHELKTPIASLRVHLHNLSEDMSHASIRAMQQGLAQLNHVVEQMLTLARTEPELWHKQFSSQELVALTQTLIANHYDKVAAKNLHISLEAPQQLTLMGCQFTLTTLLSNLLSNAIKYTPTDGEIRVSIASQQQTVVWQIEDSGCGMTDSEIARVFDRFYRVGGDQHPSGEKGAGLGMAIVSHIISIYQGHIQFQRSHLGGLHVRVSLPRGLHVTD